MADMSEIIRTHIQKEFMYDRPGVELYPTLEVAPVTPRTDAYLAHYRIVARRWKSAIAPRSLVS